MPLGSTFVQTLVAHSHPGPTSGTPSPGGGSGGTSGASRVLRQLQPGDGGGGGSQTHSPWSLPPQLELGLSGRPRPHPRRSGGHSRLPISDTGKCFPPIPPHPWTAAPIQAQGWCGGAGRVKARLGNVVLIIFQGPDLAPVQNRFCLLPKGPCLLPRSF